jgi:hypothetical protein
VSCHTPLAPISIGTVPSAVEAGVLRAVLGAGGGGGGLAVRVGFERGVNVLTVPVVLLAKEGAARLVVAV